MYRQTSRQKRTPRWRAHEIRDMMLKNDALVSQRIYLGCVKLARPVPTTAGEGDIVIADIVCQDDDNYTRWLGKHERG